MREAIAEYLPWGLSALSLVMAWLTGNRHRRVWLFGLFIQCLWLLWVCASAKWGFLPLTAWLFVIYTRNHVKWERERKAAERSAYRHDGDEVFRSYPESVRPYRTGQWPEPYRKELWRDGRMIASVDMAPAGSAAEGLGRRAGTLDAEYLQEDRRKRTSWWRKDPWAPDPLEEVVWQGDLNGGVTFSVEKAPSVSDATWPDANPRWIGARLYRDDAQNPNPLRAPPSFNKYGHEAHCSLMFPATLNTEDDRCDCRAEGHDYPACGVFRGGKCSCDAQDH